MRRFLAASGACVLAAVAASAQTVTTVIPQIDASGDVALGPDEAVYIADFGKTIRAAGGANVYRLADGKVAVFSTGFGGASGNEFTSDGQLLQSDVAKGEVHRIAPDGTRTRIAEGLTSPVGIASAGDGAVYVTQCSTNMISRIQPDKQVQTVAEGSPLNCPNGLTIGPDGALYAANFRDGAIVRIDLSTGALLNFATLPGGGNGHIASANGRFYVASFSGNRLYEVSAEGHVCPLAGTGDPGSTDGEAASATFFKPNGIAVTQDGDSLYTNTVLPDASGTNPNLHPNALRKLSGLLTRPACTS